MNKGLTLTEMPTMNLSKVDWPDDLTKEDWRIYGFSIFNFKDRFARDPEGIKLRVEEFDAVTKYLNANPEVAQRFRRGELLYHDVIRKMREEVLELSTIPKDATTTNFSSAGITTVGAEYKRDRVRCSRIRKIDGLQEPPEPREG